MRTYGTCYGEFYDLMMRSRGKDYLGESEEVARLARKWNPAAGSLLDLACGTGLHLQFLAKLFDHVTGLDRSEAMLSLARSRVPELVTRHGDMRSFRLEERFDAITCMFAIPHLRSTDELAAMVGCCVRHLAPGGVVVIDPWFTPGEFVPGYIATDLVRDGERTVYRVSHSTPSGEGRVRMVVHYVEAHPGDGIQHSTETLELTLFTRDQFREAFARAGCAAVRVPSDRFPRGLWIARATTL